MSSNVALLNMANPSSVSSFSIQRLYQAHTTQDLSCPFDTDIYDPTNNATSLPAVVLEDLPTFIHDPSSELQKVLEVTDDIDAFLEQDLNVARLNEIHNHLWACGRPMKARPLHRQQMMGRSVVVTEQADLHLLYHSDVLFLKPLPAYLLSRATWTIYFNHKNRKELHKSACGFLLTYAWLVRSPLDFKIAEQENLLPPTLTWATWKAIIHEFLLKIDVDGLEQVNKRYHWGELRLHRINTVYRTVPRFIFTHFVRGYLYGYNRYQTFFQRSVGWALVVFVWFSLILSAMQVGTTVPQLRKSQPFQNASYGFVVYSIVIVAALVLFVGGLFIMMFVFNMFAAIHHAGKEARNRQKSAGERKSKPKDV